MVIILFVGFYIIIPYCYGLTEPLMVHWVNTGENSVIIIFGYCMNDTESYGVAEFNKEGKVLSIEEKHIFAKINYAVVGSYC